jgi:hypothetical protein
MPEWEPTEQQIEEFYDRAIDRADGETPVETPPQYDPPPRRPLGALDPREGYEPGDPKGWLL